MRRILVIGRNGQLAQELAVAAGSRPVLAVFAGRQQVDLFDPASIDRCIAANMPDAVINTAAYTLVDRAESDPEPAFQMNAVAAANLAQAAGCQGVPVVHVSTDYVFSGDSDCPYTETDSPSPLSVYGASKLRGEEAVNRASGRNVVVRSSWLFGPHGSNFLKTILQLSRERTVLSVVNDQFGCPTPASSLADALLSVAIRLAGGETLPGMMHFSGSKPCSWFSFAYMILSLVATQRRVPELRPVSTREYGAAAPRPRFSALDCSLASEYGLAAPDWQISVPQNVEFLLGGSLGIRQVSGYGQEKSVASR